jgi:DNA invertase Pin-like site-specific DNA recombinase
MNSQEKVAVYYRVSTNMQTAECQKPEVEALLRVRGMVAEVVYEERASAAKRRPRFDAMMADAAAGRFNVLVVWALDRFGRSMGGNVRDLLALDKAGVRVVSVKEPWLDTAGPVRELLVAIFSWVAQQERERLIERTRAGIAAARARGMDWGRRSKNMVPPGERRRMISQWEDEGRPDGYVGLASQLGCASTATAWKMHRLWLATLAKASDTEFTPPTLEQKTEYKAAAPMVVL